MDLHLCCCRLQLGPHAKSGDASDVGQGQSGAPGSKENLWLPADAAKSLLPFLPSQNRDAWRESKSSCPFFRSLLMKNPSAPQKGSITSLFMIPSAGAA